MGVEVSLHSSYAVEYGNYTSAEEFIDQRSSIFRLIVKLYPKEKRELAMAMYAFFRMADDLVDIERVTLDEFRTWREQSLKPASEQLDPVLAAWADVRERYKINPGYIENILDGIEMDLTHKRYKTFDEFWDYTYKVACNTGFLAFPFIGLRKGVTLEQATPYILGISKAVQLTNVIRDVAEDLREGRIYIPEEVLAQFGLSFGDIEAQKCDERFRRMMKDLAQMARMRYLESWPVFRMFSLPGLLFAGLGTILYMAHLEEVERVNYNVFEKEIHLSGFRKLWLLLTRWPAILWPSTVTFFFKR
jgi:15-cis-phytoene synthase